MPSFSIGGIQVRLAGIINHLGTRYRHSIISLSDDLACQARLDPALPIELWHLRLPARNIAAALLACRRTIAAVAPDLLLTYNWGTIEWALANSIRPFCRHIHLEDGFGPEEADHQFLRRILMRRWVLRRASTVIVPSRALATIAQRDWKLSGQQIRYIPNGIDIERFIKSLDRGSAAKDQFSAAIRGGRRIVIGTIAPLRPEKNLERLLRAFAALPPGPDARLVVAGDGPTRTALEAIAAALKIAEHVLFVGAVHAPETVLASFDIFALSSDTEQMPLAVLEAMAAGLPLVATDVGDIKHMVAAPNRPFILPKEAEGQLSSALATLAGDKELRHRLGVLNRQRVQTDYSWQRMIDCYEATLAL